jgi:hypothetical protein
MERREVSPHLVLAESDSNQEHVDRNTQRLREVGGDKTVFRKADLSHSTQEGLVGSSREAQLDGLAFNLPVVNQNESFRRSCYTIEIC